MACFADVSKILEWLHIFGFLHKSNSYKSVEVMEEAVHYLLLNFCFFVWLMFLVQSLENDMLRFRGWSYR